MEILTTVIFCIIVCFMIKPLSNISQEIKIVCSTAAACILAMHFLDYWKNIASVIETIFSQTSIDGEYLKIIFKSLGICCVTQLGCDCCKDSGENAMSSQLELVGKAAILVTSLPLFSAAAEMIKTLLMI